MKPDGVFLSNGPGDPAATGEYAVPEIKKLVASGKPVFGICLGHQMLALALGAKTHKMHQGHHGANHPVKDFTTGKVEIVSMNHGFAVDRDSLPKGVVETHVSLFDGSNCGIARRRPAGLLGAVSPRGLARPAGQPLSLQAFRRGNEKDHAARGLIRPRIDEFDAAAGEIVDVARGQSEAVRLCDRCNLGIGKAGTDAVRLETDKSMSAMIALQSPSMSSNRYTAAIIDRRSSQTGENEHAWFDTSFGSHSCCCRRAYEPRHAAGERYRNCRPRNAAQGNIGQDDHRSCLLRRRNPPPRLQRTGAAITEPRQDGIDSPVPGLIGAYRFGADQPGIAIADDRLAEAFHDGDGWIWLHLNLADRRCPKWLSRTLGIDQDVATDFSEPAPRQIVTAENGVLLGHLADFRRDFDVEPTEPAWLHFILGDRLLITGRSRAVQSAEQMRRVIGRGLIFPSPAEFLVDARHHFHRQARCRDAPTPRRNGNRRGSHSR